MSSGATAQDSNWKSREQGEEGHYVNQKEQAQLQAIRDQIMKDETAKQEQQRQQKDFEGGFGGQEDLEDRYATTSGEH